MAAQTVVQNRRNELNQLVRSWDQRLRTQQMLVWLPRCLMPGLALGVALALISRTRPWLMTGQIIQITAVAVFAIVVAMILIVWSMRRTNLLSARRFDVQFGLKERVSTALELMAGIIYADDALVARQIEDAWVTAKSVQPNMALPFIWRWQEWVGVAMMAVALTILLVMPNPQETAIEQNAAQQAVIAAAAEEVKQITEEIASDPTLPQETRQELLQSLEASQQVLNEPNITPEEAFAALSDAEEALEERAADLNQQAAGQQSALEVAGAALQQFNSNPPAENNPASNPSESVDQLAEDVPGMDVAQQQQAADALEQAAQSLENSNPEAAQALRDAADALRSGDSSAAQQSLQEASGELQDAETSVQEQQASAEQLEQSAESVRESADQVSQSSQQQGQSGEAEPREQGAQQNQDGQSGESEEQQGEQESQGGQSSNEMGQPQQSGQNGQSEGSQQQGEDGQATEGGDTSGQSESGGQSQGAEGEGSQSQGQQVQGQSDAGGVGAGDAQGGAGSDSPGGQASSGDDIPQTNNPDGQGESQYDPVYAPQRIGGEGGENINLEPDASNAPVQQGEFSQNPTGDSAVPYNEVFSDYSDAANRALETDYIPLGMRDVVRDYFSSLEPGQGNSQGNGSQP